MNLTRHILATLAIAVAFGAAAIAGDNTLLDVYQSSKEVRNPSRQARTGFHFLPTMTGPDGPTFSEGTRPPLSGEENNTLAINGR